MKYVVVILDGLADRPCAELQGKTPLQAAFTPNLSRWAQKGQVGMLRIAKEIAPQSHVGALSVLGYSPFKFSVGRGFLEAKGMDMTLQNGEVAFRVNFATVKPDGRTLVDRRAGRSCSHTEAKQLLYAIQTNVHLKDASFRLKLGKKHRAVLILQSKRRLSRHVTNTDPAYGLIRGLGAAKKSFPKKVLSCRPLRKQAVQTARLVNSFTKQAFDVLQHLKINLRRLGSGQSPVNMLLLRDPEDRDWQLPKMPGRWAVISDMSMQEGLARLLAMHVVAPPSTLQAKAQKVVRLLSRYRGIYVHLKSPDEYGHAGDAKGKKENIEQIDACFFSVLAKRLDFGNTRVLVTADHATPCELQRHSNDTVPFLLVGPGVPPQHQAFQESNSAKALDAWRLLPRVFSLTTDAKKDARKSKI